MFQSTDVAHLLEPRAPMQVDVKLIVLHLSDASTSYGLDVCLAVTACTHHSRYSIKAAQFDYCSASVAVHQYTPENRSSHGTIGACSSAIISTTWLTALSWTRDSPIHSATCNATSHHSTMLSSPDVFDRLRQNQSAASRVARTRRTGPLIAGWRLISWGGIHMCQHGPSRLRPCRWTSSPCGASCCPSCPPRQSPGRQGAQWCRAGLTVAGAPLHASSRTKCPRRCLPGWQWAHLCQLS